MAIGLGLMIGLSFPDNFQQPYRAQSITEFWRRWHMTLSRWFRDYLYIPLGGNRRGSLRTALNLWIVFLLCGLWHGAALTFVAWGAYHGALLIIERTARDRFGLEPRGLLGVVLTTVAVIVGWVLFRSADFAQAQYMLAKLFFFDTSGIAAFDSSYYVTPYVVALFAGGLLLAWLPVDRWDLRARLTGRRAAQAALLGIVLVAAAVAELAASGFNPFIYFQF
jgi:alginate O-acetyltransferase complex protein AlgI